MTRRPRTIDAIAISLTAIAMCLWSSAPASSGQTDDDPVSTVEEATAVIDELEAERADIDGSLVDLVLAREGIQEDLDSRDDRRTRATRDLRRARAGAQSLAVLAYMTADGGSTGLGDGSGADAVYQDTLVRDGADARRRAATYYRDLARQADAAVTSTVEHLDELDDHIAALSRQLDLTDDELRGAASDLEAARVAEEERDRVVAADLADLGGGAPDPSPLVGGPWTPIGTIPGGPSAQQWAQLRNCESTGNYQAVSAGGAYRGAYQFDLSTWASMGGSGDPIAASAAEQDHRAQQLWQARGDAPWPICGRFLR